MSQAASFYYPHLLPRAQSEHSQLPPFARPRLLAKEHSRLPSGANPVKGRSVTSREAMTQDQAPTQSRPESASDAAESHEEDVRLVARAQAGEPAAFDTLVLKHTGKLYGLVYHMTSNHDDTNDLLQEIWTKVYRSLAGFRGASRFTTWVHSIAVNMTINFVKRRSKRQTFSLDEPDSQSGEVTANENLLVSPHTPRSEASLGELQQQLTRALNQLTPDHRAVVTMFDIQGMPHAEISKILGVSEGTVRSRLFYAHKQLQSFLSEIHSQLTNR